MFNEFSKMRTSKLCNKDNHYVCYYHVIYLLVLTLLTPVYVVLFLVGARQQDC